MAIPNKLLVVLATSLVLLLFGFNNALAQDSTPVKDTIISHNEISADTILIEEDGNGEETEEPIEEGNGPSCGRVYDWGAGADEEQFSTSFVSVSWSGFGGEGEYDAHGSLTPRYYWSIISEEFASDAIIAAPGEADDLRCRVSQGFEGEPDIMEWTEVDTTYATNSRLSLQPGATYFVVLRVDYERVTVDESGETTYEVERTTYTNSEPIYISTQAKPAFKQAFTSCVIVQSRTTGVRSTGSRTTGSLTTIRLTTASASTTGSRTTGSLTTIRLTTGSASTTGSRTSGLVSTTGSRTTGLVSTTGIRTTGARSRTPSQTPSRSPSRTPSRTPSSSPAPRTTGSRTTGSRTSGLVSTTGLRTTVVAQTSVARTTVVAQTSVARTTGARTSGSRTTGARTTGFIIRTTGIVCPPVTTGPRTTGLRITTGPVTSVRITTGPVTSVRIRSGGRSTGRRELASSFNNSGSPPANDSSGLDDWQIALIVLACVFFVLLLLVILFIIFGRGKGEDKYNTSVQRHENVERI